MNTYTNRNMNTNTKICANAQIHNTKRKNTNKEKHEYANKEIQKYTKNTQLRIQKDKKCYW